MGRRTLTVATIALAAWLPAGAAHAAIGPAQVEALDRQGATEIIVRREPGLSAAERADVRADADVTLERHSTITDTEVVRADAGELAEAVAELNRDPDVVYAEPVTIQSAQTADPYWGSLWGLDNVGQQFRAYYPAGTPDADMDVPEAWAKATGAGVTVGVVDTGVVATHPDLVNQLATNPGETGTDALGRDKRSNGVDDDGNGYRDDWRGWDFVSQSSGVTEGDSTAGPDNDPQDNHGHGTHVAGTIAAQRDNNEGIAGVAPGARIMALRGLGSSGQGSSLAIAEAFDYAGKLGLRVVNASLGGPGIDQTQLAAVQAHPNTLYVIAAGNSNIDVDATPYGPCALPAANVLCVGASDENDRRAGFSNFGANNVDVFAPGTAILSTYPSSAYEYLQGTSMATPNTAGVAALVLSAGPAQSALDVKSAIMGSVDAKPDLTGKSVTGGRVNAERAVSGVVGGAPKNVTPPAISGTPRRGTALTASTGTWSPAGASYGYVWERSSDNGSTWTPIAGATASTYTPGASDVAGRLRVTITATNPYGVASASSPAVGPVDSGAPVATSPPVVNGVLRKGQVLTIGGAWNPAGTAYAYRWDRSPDGVAWTTIGGDTSSYTLTSAEREAYIRVTVTATNAYGQTTLTSAPVGPVLWAPPANTAPPVLSGTPQRTFILNATPGAWSGVGNVYTYRWQRDDGNGWGPINGVTTSTYRLAKEDEGARVRVIVTATNVDGTAEQAGDATAAPVSPFPPANTAEPVISGTAQRAGTLSATRGTWTGPDNAYAYQWQRDFGEGYVDIAGATGATYTLTVADVDATVRVLVTATNPDATIVEASQPTTPVLAAGPLNQTPPTVSGTAQRGLVLTGTAGTWTGIGNTIGYQWQSSSDGTNWADIAGATSPTHTIGAASVGSYVRLLVTVTNPDGTKTATSTATARVAGAPPANTVRPAVSGTAQRGSVLSATPGTWTGNGNGYTYQWQRDTGAGFVAIAGATDPTYTLAPADVNATVRVLVTATNPDGTAGAASTATPTIPSAPPVNTVKPSVSGSAQRGQTLTGSGGTWSGIGNSTSFQWQSSADGSTWSAIAGATGASHALGAGDIGRALRLLVTVANPDGIATATSIATAVVAAAPPVNSVRPAVSGAAQRTSTLTGTPGSWSGNGNAYAYQWQRSANGTTWVDIAGATAAGYELTVADVGASVRLLVTASNPDATATATSAATATIAGAPPVNTVRPTIGGTAQRASTLTGTPGTWSGLGNAYAYQWQRSLNGTTWVDIAGATATGYELTVADVGASVRLLVTVSNPDATATATSSPTATIPSAAPVNTAAPTVSGTTQRGSTLTATAGIWSGIGNSASYQWQRSSNGTWVDIAGATGSTYALGTTDVGRTVRVSVTVTNPERSATAVSNASATVLASGPVNTVAPVISGTAQRTFTLTATQGTWSGNQSTYAYQWQRSADGITWLDVAGATGAAYELAVADVRAKVRVLVTATNPDGAGSRASAPTATVSAAPPVNTNLPIVTGATLRGTTLSASQGTWSGPGIAYAYQWQRDVGSGYTDVPGATGTTYLLGVADVGSTLRVRVTATNADASVSAASIDSSVVKGGQPVNTGAPTISGTARRTSTLASMAGVWSGIENDYAYQWQRRVNGSFADIPGATATTYTLGSADVGTVVRLRVTATNLEGAVSAVSAATATVAAAPPRNTGLPTVTGAARLNETLTATPGDWTPAGADFAYAWQRDGVDIPGATDTTYTLRAADLGKSIRVRVTATNVDGSSVATAAATERIAAPPVNTVPPDAPSGTPQEGSTLTAAPGSWDTPGASFAYTWLRCPADTSTGCEEAGAGSTYTLSAADVGRRLGVRVVATSGGGRATAVGALTGTVARLVLRSLTAPSIAGSAYVGETLTGDAGRWTFAAVDVAYDWQRCDADGQSDCASVGDGTSQYVVGAGDADHTIVLVVAAATPGQSATARSAPSAIRVRPVPRSVVAPSVSGTATRGRTLTAGTGTWTESPTGFAYQWLRCDGGSCRPIADATADTYVLTAADKGFAVTVAVTATNAWGPGSAKATLTAPIAPAPPVNTGVPVIAGTTQQGMTLTASIGAWTTTPDTTYRLQWERCAAGSCRPVGGASGAHYTLLAADVGATLVVVSTATNSDGSVSARSAETAAATLIAGPRWKTLPTISNSTGRVGDTVTATPGTFSGPAVTSDVTELMRCTNVCTSRGAARTYTIADGDLGAILRVRETAANAGGETVVWSSRYVGPVINAQSAAAVLTKGATAIRNAQGATLAVATLSGAKAGLAHASAARPKVTLRRPAKVKGKLVAWACPATIAAGATPPPCSKRISLRKRATLSLPAATGTNVRVVVIRPR